MANDTLKVDVRHQEVRISGAASQTGLDRASAAFGLAAAVAIVFNTVLAWIKDAYAPLNAFMAHLTGHHWTTHGLADLLLFVVLGFAFLYTGVAERVSARTLVATLVVATICAGLGLAAWFVLF